MIEEKAYWMWLQHAFGPGSAKPVRIGKRFSCLEEFFKGGRGLWAGFSLISERELAALGSFSPTQAQAQLEYTRKVGQEAVAYCDEEYPEILKHIDDPPAVFYVKGELPDFDNVLAISVVGSREAGEIHIKQTELISYELSKEGAVVVSGGALGIDAAAHRGAMRGAAPTICVLACGIDFPYLMENQMLRGRVVEKGGALITEYPVNTGVNRGTFSVRNRIISGLSQGLLVAAAAKKSGTMLTVAHATKQNKDIYAMPGQLGDPLAEGPNLLIRDGAKQVLSAEDILEEYRGRYRKEAAIPRAAAAVKPLGAKPVGLSGNAQMVYAAVGTAPEHLSAIIAKTGLRASQVQAAATELELMGILRSYSGQRYALNSK